jgi:hypothetical protein
MELQAVIYPNDISFIVRHAETGDLIDPTTVDRKEIKKIVVAWPENETGLILDQHQIESFRNAALYLTLNGFLRVNPGDFFQTEAERTKQRHQDMQSRINALAGRLAHQERIIHDKKVGAFIASLPGLEVEDRDFGVSGKIQERPPILDSENYGSGKASSTPYLFPRRSPSFSHICVERCFNVCASIQKTVAKGIRQTATKIFSSLSAPSLKSVGLASAFLAAGGLFYYQGMPFSNPANTGKTNDEPSYLPPSGYLLKRSPHEPGYWYKELTRTLPGGPPLVKTGLVPRS